MKISKQSIFDEPALEKFRKQHKLQPYRIKQIYAEIFKNANINFEDMTTLSKDLRQLLDENFYILDLQVDKIYDEKTTTKASFITQDDKIIETMLIYHTHDDSMNDNKLNRITICLSSQIGCAMGCKFCVTGKLGLTRNLSWQEMISQILWANNFIKNKYGKKPDNTLWKVRNVVFMGMGEPLLNYNETIKAINIMLDITKLSLGKRHITISTCGIIPGIRKLIQDEIPVMLAISLHAPNQDLRNELMPIAGKYGLSELMQVLDEYYAKTKNRLFYEYIMIKNITDTPELAQQLAKLLKGKPAHVNLIAYNENPAAGLYMSDDDSIQKFKNILEKNNITATVRTSFGQEVKGACGQLGYDYITK